MFDYSNSEITVFGDSITRGLCLNNGVIDKIVSPCVDILSQALNKKIINISTFGQTLKRATEKGIFTKYVANLSSNDNIAIIALGGNDSDFNWDEVEKIPDGKHIAKTPPEEFRTILRENFLLLQSAKVKVVALSLFPINARRYFDNVLAKKYNGDAIKQYLCGDISNLNRNQEAYNAIITSVANETKASFIDYRSELLMKGNLNDYLCEDGIHPNSKGHSYIADFILKHYSLNK